MKINCWITWRGLNDIRWELNTGYSKWSMPMSICMSISISTPVFRLVVSVCVSMCGCGCVCVCTGLCMLLLLLSIFSWLSIYVCTSVHSCVLCDIEVIAHSSLLLILLDNLSSVAVAVAVAAVASATAGAGTDRLKSHSWRTGL